MRLVAIGDIGVVDNMIHIGDEAMFESFLDRMRARGVGQVIALSAAPAETAARYGVTAQAQVGFGRSGSTGELAGRLDRVLRTASGARGLLEGTDPALGVIEAIGSSDAVAITGGGNLASTWPANIAKRVAIGAIAQAVGTPLVVTGQTLGPELTGEDAVLVGRLLRSARLVGVRERPSFAVATRLGVAPARLRQTVDDASFLGSGLAEPSPFIAVTLSVHLGGVDRRAFVARMAALLDTLAGVTGLGVRFLPHFGSLQASDRRGDTGLHDAVHAELATADVRHVTPTDSQAAAAVGRRAALVITSRYHPAVFAVSAGVPTIGISVDEYTSVKLTGALEAFGQDGVIGIEDVLRGSADSTVLAVWDRREDIRTRGRDLAAAHASDSESWWDRVVAALGT